jgi:hypothetical protein
MSVRPLVLFSRSTLESITLADTDLLPVENLNSEFSIDSEIVSSGLHLASDDGYVIMFIMLINT